VSQGLIGTAAALAVMLGADVGTALMVQVFSLNLTWLAPLLIVAGVDRLPFEEERTRGADRQDRSWAGRDDPRAATDQPGHGTADAKRRACACCSRSCPATCCSTS
jgi:hypothetical protein